MNMLRLATIAAFSLPLLAHGSGGSAAPTAPAATIPAHETETPESFHKLARKAMANEEGELAEMYFGKLFALPVNKAEKREALIEYGRFLEDKQSKLVKAAAIYEQVLSLFPGDSEVSDLSLRLGRIYRGLGTFKGALGKFYNVLHASLRVKDGELYKARALQAQFEIAETHFAAGEYAEAAKFYARLKLIDMPPAERSQVHFKSAYILFLNKDFSHALISAREFLAEFSGHALAPECQYLLVQTLRGLHRNEEALTETLKLLRAGKAHGKEHPEVWAYWLQKIGNELANELYANNDPLNALSVYQLLAELTEVPEWRLPAVYQIALCFERLRHLDRAIEAYRFIGKAPATPAQPAPAAAPSVNLATLRELAQWRLNHLEWLISTEKELHPLLGKASEDGLKKAGFRVGPDLRAEAAPPAAAPAPAVTAAQPVAAH